MLVLFFAFSRVPLAFVVLAVVCFCCFGLFFGALFGLVLCLLVLIKLAFSKKIYNSMKNMNKLIKKGQMALLSHFKKHLQYNIHLLFEYVIEYI